MINTHIKEPIKGAQQMKFFKCHSQKMKNEKIICLEDKYTDIGPDVFDGFEVEYIILADTTKIIRDYAFSGLGKCSVYLPKSVSEIEPLAFENTNPLVTFYCSNGSYAAKICNNNNLTVNYNINEIFEIVEEKKRAISGISQRMSNEQTFQEDAEENFVTSNNDKKEYPDKSQKENESSISLDSSEDIFNAVDSKEQLRNDSDKKNKKQVDSTESSFFAGKEEIIFQVKSLVASASDFNELKSVYNNVNKE